MDVDRLGADQDQGIALLPERIKRVEEGVASGNEDRIRCASRVRSVPSNPAVLLLPPGRGRGW
ncbi:MAG: hypothetical protein NVS9B6_17130 [Candidatus Limnocylindrales bacterium]